MTPEIESKINVMHDTLILMKNDWRHHLENHPKQPCPYVQEVKSDIKEIKRSYLSVAFITITALVGALYKVLAGGN